MCDGIGVWELGSAGEGVGDGLGKVFDSFICNRPRVNGGITARWVGSGVFCWGGGLWVFKVWMGSLGIQGFDELRVLWGWDSATGGKC